MINFRLILLSSFICVLVQQAHAFVFTYHDASLFENSKRVDDSSVLAGFDVCEKGVCRIFAGAESVTFTKVNVERSRDDWEYLFSLKAFEQHFCEKIRFDGAEEKCPSLYYGWRDHYPTRDEFDKDYLEYKKNVLKKVEVYSITVQLPKPTVKNSSKKLGSVDSPIIGGSYEPRSLKIDLKKGKVIYFTTLEYLALSGGAVLMGLFLGVMTLSRRAKNKRGEKGKE